MVPTPITERLATKVDKSGPGGCWLFTGAVEANGYGVMHGGNGKGKVYAHRVSYELAKGPIPSGLEVRHSCDVRSCVNPDHLDIGTRADNMHDMWGRGRGVSFLARRTHCNKGHEFTPENTSRRKHNGVRRCKACDREYMAAFRAARRST